MINPVFRPRPRVKSCRCHNRFKRRSRLVKVDNRSVFIGRRISFAVIIGIKIRPARHSQNLACFRIHNDDGGPFRFVFFHDFVKAFFGNVLNRAVNGETNGTFLVGQHFFQGRIKNRHVITVRGEPKLLRITANLIVKNHFNTVETVIVITDKADKLSGQSPVRIVTPVFVNETKPFYLFFGNEFF